MSDQKPQFEFDLRITARDLSGYYHPRWDRAERVTVRASTKGEAFTKAFAMLGDCPRGHGWCWTGITDSIREVTDV